MILYSPDSSVFSSHPFPSRSDRANRFLCQSNRSSDTLFGLELLTERLELLASSSPARPVFTVQARLLQDLLGGCHARARRGWGNHSACVYMSQSQCSHVKTTCFWNMSPRSATECLLPATAPCWGSAQEWTLIPLTAKLPSNVHLRHVFPRGNIPSLQITDKCWCPNIWVNTHMFSEIYCVQCSERSLRICGKY